MRDSLNRYITDIGKLELLDSEEEMELARKSKTCNQARNKLVKANLRLVIHIAKRYSQKGVMLHDLIQEGNLGLMKAVEKFDPERGNRFSTYATWWIKKEVLKALNHNSNKKELYTDSIEDAREESTDIMDDIISFEIQNKLDTAMEKLKDVGAIGQKDITVFKARVYLEMTLAEIAEELKVTRQRVGQIEQKIINQIKNKESLKHLIR